MNTKNIKNVIEESLLEAKDCANYWLEKSIDSKIRSERKKADEAYDRYVIKIVTLEELLEKVKS